MKESPILSLSGVSKKIGNFQVGPVNIQLEPGYVYTLVGPNGAGKSTLFRLIMNLIQPDQGNLTIFGHSYPEYEKSIKQRIGYIPEHPLGFETYSGKQLTQFFAQVYPTWDEQKYQTLIQRFDIDLRKKMSQLSKGKQRKLMFALTMGHNPDLLLMDEPTAGLDLFAQQAFIEEITHYMQDGTRTLFLATHQMNEIRRIADFIILFSQGKVLGVYEKDQLLDRWKKLWIEKEIPHTVPGVVHQEQGSPVLVVTENIEQTMSALRSLDIPVLQLRSMEIDDILAYLLVRK